MKILFIGGSGTISSAITELLAGSQHQLTLINRGNKNNKVPENVEIIVGDITDEDGIKRKLENRTFDVVVNFIAFGLKDVERDFRIFGNITRQYVFISTASAYQKPPVDSVITESTPLVNPYWEYSRNKIKCEEFLMEKFRSGNFPVTIIRPSHTYGDKSIPVALYGQVGSWQVIRRMVAGKPVLIPGDGSTLWTMTHNTDFAKGFAGILGNPRALGQAIHITSDEALTWNQIYETIASKLGVKLQPFYVPSHFLATAGKKYGYDYTGSLLGDKANNAVFDNSKIKRLVPGFDCMTRYDMGVDIALANIMANPELQTTDSAFDEFCDEVIEAMNEIYDKFQ